MLLTGIQTLELDKIKLDLRYQLQFEDMDWEYFIDTALRAKEIEDIKLQESRHEN